MRKFLKYSKVFGILIGVFILFAAISCCLPNKIVRQNISMSIFDFTVEQDYPTGIIQGRPYTLDNFTDALILDMAYCANSNGLINSVFAPKYAVLNKVMNENLQQLTAGNIEPNVIYTRYWHGSPFLIRFFLLFGNYNSIRYFLYIVTSILLLLTCCTLFRKSGFITTTGFFAGFILLNGFMMQFSMQFATDLILALLFTIIVCHRYPDSKSLPMLLFIDGCVTCYFDLLTTPVLTLGLPMIVHIMLDIEKQRQESLREGIVKVIVPSILWGVGYFFTWISKWILATIFTSYNALKDGIKQTLFRSSTGDGITRWSALTENLGQVSWTAVLVFVILILIFILLAFNKKNYKSILLLTPFMILPYCWYMFAANHSFLHCWFTYRDQMVTVSAIFFALSLLVDWTRICQFKLFKNRKHNAQKELNADTE